MRSLIISILLIFCYCVSSFAAITGVDDIAVGLSSQQDITFIKNLTAPKAAGAFQSSWLAAGWPGAGSNPPAYTAGSGYTTSSATSGCMTYSNGAVQNWLAKAMMSATQPGTIILMDRLWAVQGFTVTSTSAQSVTTPGNLPARITDNGVGVEAWVEVYTATGAASGTFTLNYLNAATGASKSGVIAAVVSAPVAGQLQPIPLAVGDTGVRQVTSIQQSATWTSGGPYGITLAKRIAQFPVLGVGLGTTYDWAQLGLPKIPADACLMVAFLAQNTTAPVIIGSLDVIDK